MFTVLMELEKKKKPATKLMGMKEEDAQALSNFLLQILNN